MSDFRGLDDLVDDFDHQHITGTTISKSITVIGEIEGDEFLTVEGRVEGKIILKNGILVKKDGLIKADIKASSISISGSIIGNIEATEKIEILKDGKVIGDIKAPNIVINDGAKVRGQIIMDFAIDETKKDSAKKEEIKKDSSSNLSSGMFPFKTNNEQQDKNKPTTEPTKKTDENITKPNESTHHGKSSFIIKDKS